MNKTDEGQHLDRKSLRGIVGRRAEFSDLAKDCVCFANGSGGKLLIGIEDDKMHPPADQRIEPFVPPALLRSTGMDKLTSLKRIEPHRLRALILEDVTRYPNSGSSDIHRRVGPEILVRTFRRGLKDLVSEGLLTAVHTCSVSEERTAQRPVDPSREPATVDGGARATHRKPCCCSELAGPRSQAPGWDRNGGARKTSTARMPLA